MTDQNERWYQASATTEIQACRTGWRGVLDAIRAAWTGNDRLTVPETVRFSVMVKTDKPEQLAFNATQGNNPLAMHMATVEQYGEFTGYIRTGGSIASGPLWKSYVPEEKP